MKAVSRGNSGAGVVLDEGGAMPDSDGGKSEFSDRPKYQDGVKSATGPQRRHQQVDC